jgi:hypothetical protein
MRFWGYPGLYHGLDEMYRAMRGEPIGHIAADRLSQAAREDWTSEEPSAATRSNAKAQPKFWRRALWRLGALLVRGGQNLQERFCVEPACAEA